MFNVWIVGALLLLLLLIIASFGRGDEQRKDELVAPRRLPMNFDVENKLKKEAIGAVEEKKDV